MLCVSNFINKAILQTVAYFDVFDYPVTSDQLWFFLGASKPYTVDERRLKGLNIVKKNGFYCFSDRTDIINIRIKREKESKKKLKIVKKIISRLSFIPTISFVGLTGALAMNNSDKKDDIDLFVIVKKGTLWTTRLILLIVLQISGYRRAREDKKVENKICLNMLIDESALCFPKERQDFYTAHEIIQMKPIFERNNMYQKFINANLWVGKFLPNAMIRIKDEPARNASQSNAGGGLMIKKEPQKMSFIIHHLSFIIESVAKYLQFWYMKRHLTHETIKDNFLAFHPIDYRKIVTKRYLDRLKRYNIE